MRFKRSIIACVAAAGMGGLAFGGSAVATSFTSTSQQDYAEGQGATTGIELANGNLDATGLVPGANLTPAGTVDISNDGNVSGVVTIKFGDFTVKKIGSDGTNPRAEDLQFYIAGIGYVTADVLADHTFTLLHHLGVHQHMGFAVSIGLLTGTGNNWNGADAYLPYTVTLTAGS
jgi:hypothetical protein